MINSTFDQHRSTHQLDLMGLPAEVTVEAEVSPGLLSLYSRYSLIDLGRTRESILPSAMRSFVRFWRITRRHRSMSGRGWAARRNKFDDYWEDPLKGVIHQVSLKVSKIMFLKSSHGQWAATAQADPSELDPSAITKHGIRLDEKRCNCFFI